MRRLSNAAIEERTGETWAEHFDRISRGGEDECEACGMDEVAVVEGEYTLCAGCYMTAVEAGEIEV